MFPRWHIFLGVVFTFVIWILVPNIQWYALVLIFFSSFLIDFDHYVTAVAKTKNWNLKNAFEYNVRLIQNQEKEVSKGIKKKGDFYFFHTVEFHALIGIISLLFKPFFFIFIGMVFHSILDVISMSYDRQLHTREFFFFNWLRKKIT